MDTTTIPAPFLEICTELSTALVNHYHVWRQTMPTCTHLYDALVAHDKMAQYLENVGRMAENEPTMVSMGAEQLNFLLLGNGGIGLTDHMWRSLLAHSPRLSVFNSRPVSWGDIGKALKPLRSDEDAPDLPGFRATSKSQKRRLRRIRSLHARAQRQGQN